MKTIKYLLTSLSITVCSGFIACEDFLDREPMSDVSPEIYFTDVSQLVSYANSLYKDILPSHGQWGYGIFGEDEGTDNQAGLDAHDRFTSDRWKVPNTETSNWKFEWIYRTNYFFSQVMPKFGETLDGKDNTIAGDLSLIKHYIGEVYFLRACEYFKRYQKFGDFPIITEPLSDDLAVLSEASKRMPRTKVARFILSDLDKAIELLGVTDMATTRINRDVALLLKSRVALFEGTWLRYFQGTPFVPKGEGWPGASKEYNAGFEFESGSIENEIHFFLDEAMAAAKLVGEKYKSLLTINTGGLQQSVGEPANPYFDMFAQEDLSSVSEVLLWRQYARGLETHNVNVVAARGNQGIGLTRAFVNNFLMQDGTPPYTHGTYAEGDDYYKGDKTLADVRVNRDLRLNIFLKEPGQKNILIENVEGDNATLVETYPNITIVTPERAYSTGYALRKGGSFDQKHYANGAGYTAAICYRATEALLNYMEASYERNHVVDATAREYWTLLRERAGITAPLEVTINATDMTKEAVNDWGAYSKGQILTDKWLYNLRRERRCELMAEGLRYMDLCRWRSMDQMINNPYHIEGMHLWNTPMQDWYDAADLIFDGSDKSTVSSPGLSEYLRPYQKNSKQIGYTGFTWRLAHYLHPIMIKQFLITSPDGSTISDSPLYQNPYWPTIADQPAEL